MLKIVKGISLSAVLALSGCVASSYVQDNLMSNDAEYAKVIDNDKMIAIGQLTGAQSSAEMLFIGEKYAYVIRRGGNQLLQMIQNIPAEQRILTSELPIKFYFNDQTNFVGMLRFRYATPLNQIDATSLAKLQKLGFNQQLNLKNSQGDLQTYLTANLSFSGQVHQAISTDKIQYKMSQPYPISMQKTISNKEHKNPAKSLAGLILMPFAIGVDVVTFPVAVGAVGYGLKHK